MRTRSVAETAIICAAAVGIIAIIARGSANHSKELVWFALTIVPTVGIVMGSRSFTASRRARIEMAGNDDYRRLAEDYRRLSDMAITAQEHSDLKLGDVSVQLDYLREQVDSLQKILKEVE